ncbi:MAG: biotin/lipoyl-binding protein, partial [Nannocystis sp.]
MPRRLALLTALVLLQPVAACSAPAGQAEAKTGPPAPRTVEVAPARRTTYARTLTLSGTLTPLEQVQVAARVEGPILEVKVDLGDVVARDQVLATIRPVDYRARVSELAAGVAQAENDVQRARDLGRAGTAEELEIA